MALQLYPVNSGTTHNVINDNDEQLGTIQHFLVDMETGRIMYAVLMSNKIASRNKLFAVPWEILDFSSQRNHFILNVPQAIVEKKIGYISVDQLLQTVDTSWLGEVYEYYYREPRWEEARAAERQEELFRVRTKREEITRRSLTYYWWRCCRRRKTKETSERNTDWATA
jgi:PRC-barrel domain